MRPGEAVAARFQVERLAGRGGMGEVWRAVDRETGEPVALKLLHAHGGEGDRFAREARLLAELRHPHIVRHVADGVTEAGEQYLAMEWLEGEDLDQRLQRAGLTVAESLTLATHVAHALAAAHARGIVHRDIKPSNLFLPSGAIAGVKLLDFGIARWQATRAATRTGIMIGTPGYMAPEQARGARDVDGRADVYALGCVLFECLTGRPAFVGEHLMALLAKILLEDAPRPRELRAELPPAVDALVARMMSKAPDGRPRDGAALHAELTALVGAHINDASLGAMAAPDPASAATPPGGRASALTISEERLVTIVAAHLGHGDTAIGDRTLTPEEAVADHDRFAQVIAPFAARAEWLADGSLVVVFAGAGAANDQVAHAARCALALRPLAGGAPMVLATGRGVVAGRLPVGEAVDRAARMLRETVVTGDDAPSIRLDEVSAGLLEAGFEVRAGGRGPELHREREAPSATRTLLGKPTPCVGRERELALLDATLAECVSEPVARAVLVTAPTGVGKSRVRHEFERKLDGRAEPAQLWLGRGDPMSAGSPFGLLRRALRRAIGLYDGEPPDAARAKLSARVAEHVPELDRGRVAQFLGELVGAPFPDDASLPLAAARRDAILMGDQMCRAWEDWLAAECAARPVVLVLEDLHWGDLPTVKFVDAALRNLRDRPFLVLALARPEVHELFPKLWVERGVQELRLAELTRRAAERLVRQVLGDVDAQTVARVVERAEGNAFYLEELIRAVAEGKGDDLPGTVLAMVQARLEALNARARHVLRASSVFGQVFWRAGVQELLGGVRTVDVGAALDELAQRELLARRPESRFPDGGDEWTFRHALVREAAYATLSADDRAVGHRLAGEWLERAGERDAMALAEHFERGGEAARAVGWYRRAAEQALEGNDFAAVHSRVARAIRSGADGEIRGALELLDAEAHEWQGHFRETLTSGEAALASLPRGGAAWCKAVGEVALASGRLVDRDRIVALGGELLAFRPDEAALRAYVISMSRLVTQVIIVGNQALAAQLVARLDELAVPLAERDPAVAGSLYEARSFFNIMVDNSFGAGTRQMLIAIEQFERAGDLRNACAQRINIGFGMFEMGRYAHAEETMRDVLAVGERLGLERVTNVARVILGGAMARQGRLDEAMAVEQHAADAFRALGDWRFEGTARVQLAHMHVMRGALDEAERQAREALELLGRVPMHRPLALAMLARILLTRGQAREALGHAAEAVTIRRTVIAATQLDVRPELAYAEALHDTGDLEGARRAIAELRALLLDRASRNQDQELRDGYLAVAEHARVFQLAAEWNAT